ncbi:error-prone DNA polymerase [Ramlibacter solisilvae]|uniref:Error-prone DNA polymerase n=1 Tax=Ramlibacter tataouinensis TaxID=94132 RepID=A0A127K119_9BURK|nr:error-prone DNA polymerase [Ramlibacter tataouinensis]AMO24572.1 DNA polymerase [Ramlibacter tataouinensis]
MPESINKPRPLLDEDHDLPPVLAQGPDPLPRYAELHCISNFSFQRGASHPQELVRRAYDLGYEALAITDECSVAGVVRAWSGWNEYAQFIARLEKASPGERRSRHFQLLFGSEFDMGDARLVALACDLDSWGGLTQFITAARMTAQKGDYCVSWDESELGLLKGCQLLLAPKREGFELESLCARLRALQDLFGADLWLAVELPCLLDDDLWLASMKEAGERAGVRLVAAGEVHMHLRSRKPLQDVITAVRLGTPVAACGTELQGNAERHLRQRKRLAEIFPAELLAATLEVMARCRFDITAIQYNYPRETVPPGMTPTQALAQLTMQGARERYPQGIPDKVTRLLDKELRLIEQCRYEMFFLTVHDIVRYARKQQILCQGRGSAANSVVCYCLGITAMDPMHSEPLLERFISIDRRNEPPDIDVDFEHERREEVIQYIYRKYGRERAAIAAVVICYRSRSAIRDVGKALGVPEPLIDAFAKDHHWFEDSLATGRLAELAQIAGAPITQHLAAQWMELTATLMGFPRHLSQHVGGFVLTQTQLTRLVPVENASMKDRSVIQWDKDDLEDMGLMKVDVLALGMLTAIRRCLAFVSRRRGVPFTIYDVENDDPATYEMIRRADTVGVFQIESRAQMSMLPRLKPTCFYDLVIEVAIVRPGPIAGGMVHPYLKARERVAQGEAIEYERSALEPSDQAPRLQKALNRTLGVPIFQEQVMEISMIAAGFSATEADALRRAMAAWKRRGGVDKFRHKLIAGMLAKGYSQDFAERIFKQVEGFGEYGFPESHAYSFALLAYSSSWLKCHEPESFLAAMLNSQPMGFYSPSQLIQDGKRHGIAVLPPDVACSDWDSKLESDPNKNLGSDSNFRPAVRLGLRQVGGLSEKGGRRIAECRAGEPFLNVEDLALRAALDASDLKALAAGDALLSLAGHRRQQVWEAAAQQRPPELLRDAPLNEPALELEAAAEGEEIVFDYASLGFTLRRHPLALLRPKLAKRKLRSASQLQHLPHGRRVSACGIVTVRQQPQTANGTIFVTLEDETGPVNVIVWKSVREAQREPLLRARLLAVHGTWQRDVESGGQVCHLVAEQLEDLTPLLGRLASQTRSGSRDFR